MKEYLLTTDNFSNPKVLTNLDAVGTLLIRLLILIPGTNPLHPDMGVGIGTVWRFMAEDDLPDLQERVEQQISTYLPPVFQSAIVDLSIDDDNCLIINVIADGVSFVFETKGTNSEVRLSESIT